MNKNEILNVIKNDNNKSQTIKTLFVQNCKFVCNVVRDYAIENAKLNNVENGTIISNFDIFGNSTLSKKLVSHALTTLKAKNVTFAKCAAKHNVIFTFDGTTLTFTPNNYTIDGNIDNTIAHELIDMYYSTINND